MGLDDNQEEIILSDAGIEVERGSSQVSLEQESSNHLPAFPVTSTYTREGNFEYDANGVVISGWEIITENGKTSSAVYGPGKALISATVTTITAEKTTTVRHEGAWGNVVSTVVELHSDTRKGSLEYDASGTMISGWETIIDRSKTTTAEYGVGRTLISATVTTTTADKTTTVTYQGDWSTIVSTTVDLHSDTRNGHIEYDANGVIISGWETIASDGRTSTVVYGPGKVIISGSEIITSDGKTTTIEYGPGKTLISATTVTTTAEKTTTVTYKGDWNSIVSTAVDFHSDTRKGHMEYDANGVVTYGWETIVDGGKTTSAEYGLGRSLISATVITTTADRTTTVTYKGSWSNVVSTVVDFHSDARKGHIEYDANGVVVSGWETTIANGKVTSAEYGPGKSLISATSVTTTADKTTTVTYKGSWTTIVTTAVDFHSDTRKGHIEYDANGVVTSGWETIIGNGKITTAEYGPGKSLISATVTTVTAEKTTTVTYKGSWSTIVSTAVDLHSDTRKGHIEYDANGVVISGWETTIENGKITSAEYGPGKLLISAIVTTTTAEKTTVVTYKGDWNTIVSTAVDLHSITRKGHIEYDANGVVVSGWETVIDGDRTTTAEYGPGKMLISAKVTTITNEKTTIEEHEDTWGNVVSTVVELHSDTRKGYLEYDANGVIISGWETIASDGQTSTVVYGLGKVIISGSEIITSNGKTTTIEYGPGKTLISATTVITTAEKTTTVTYKGDWSTIVSTAVDFHSDTRKGHMEYDANGVVTSGWETTIAEGKTTTAEYGLGKSLISGIIVTVTADKTTTERHEGTWGNVVSKTVDIHEQKDMIAEGLTAQSEVTFSAKDSEDTGTLLFAFPSPDIVATDQYQSVRLQDDISSGAIQIDPTLHYYVL